MIVPILGTKSLGDALFSRVQQRVLALLFARPGRSFRCAELIRLAGGGTGGVHRFLLRLADAGWVTVTPVGNQRHYRANRACPGFAEMRGLVTKTMSGAETEPRRAREGSVSRPVPGPPRDDGWKAW